MKQKSLGKAFMFLLFFGVYLSTLLSYVVRIDNNASHHKNMKITKQEISKTKTFFFSKKTNVRGTNIVDFFNFFIYICYFLIPILLARGSVYFLYSLQHLEKVVLDGEEKSQPDSVINIIKSQDIQKE